MEALTKDEKIRLGTKEIALRIRKELKQLFPKCDISVTKQSYSGGSSITTTIKKTDFRVVQDVLSEDAIYNYTKHYNNYTEEQLKTMQKTGYYQINKYQLYDEFNPDTWNNGVFLTKEGYDFLKKISAVIEQYNYDESDAQIDYFSVNFYSHIELGKWDNPLIEEVV